MSIIPLHIRRKQTSAPLSPELFEKYKTRSMQVRKGDTVTITRGNFAGIEGKVTMVNYKKIILHVDGVTREKIDGTPVAVPIHPSKVAIKNLILDDKRRKEILARRSPVNTEEKKKSSERKPKTQRKKTLNKSETEEKK